MSTSLLYQAFGIRGYRYGKTEYEGGMVLFYADASDDHCRCSACGSDNVIRRGTTRRWFRSLPIGGRLTWLITDVPRVGCRDCHVVRQIELGFAAPRRTYTKRFAQYALELARTMTIKDVAAHLGVSVYPKSDLDLVLLSFVKSGISSTL